MKILKHENIVKNVLFPYFIALVYAYKQELHDYSKKKELVLLRKNEKPKGHIG